MGRHVLWSNLDSLRWLEPNSICTADAAIDLFELSTNMYVGTLVAGSLYLLDLGG